MRMKTARMTWSLLNYGASAFANDDNIYQNDRVPSQPNILLTRSVLELRRFEINGRGLFWPKFVALERDNLCESKQDPFKDFGVQPDLSVFKALLPKYLSIQIS